MAVGTHKGFVQIWDAAAGKKLFALEGHTARVGKDTHTKQTNTHTLTNFKLTSGLTEILSKVQSRKSN